MNTHVTTHVGAVWCIFVSTASSSQMRSVMFHITTRPTYGDFCTLGRGRGRRTAATTDIGTNGMFLTDVLPRDDARSAYGRISTITLKPRTIKPSYPTSLISTSGLNLSTESYLRISAARCRPSRYLFENLKQNGHDRGVQWDQTSDCRPVSLQVHRWALVPGR